MTVASEIQLGLLFVYLILTVLFFYQKQYAISIYYFGCIVKDAGVFFLSLITQGK